MSDMHCRMNPCQWKENPRLEDAFSSQHLGNDRTASENSVSHINVTSCGADEGGGPKRGTAPVARTLPRR
jgi:hypothetical protein